MWSWGLDQMQLRERAAWVVSQGFRYITAIIIRDSGLNCKLHESGDSASSSVTLDSATSPSGWSSLPM